MKHVPKLFASAVIVLAFALVLPDQIHPAASPNVSPPPAGSPVGSISPACCSGTTGNVNSAGIIDAADITALVSYLTGGGFAPPCYDAANVNGSGIIDPADLSALVSYLTGGGFLPPTCTATAFYPLSVGSYWVYADTTFDLIAHTVLSASLDSFAVIGSHQDSLGDWSVLSQPISWVSDTFMVKGDTLYSRELGYTGGLDPAPSFASAEYVPAQDTPFVFGVFHEDMLEQRTVVRVDTTIVSAAGSFAQCTHYYEAGATEIVWNDFLAPHVGLVYSSWEIRPMGRPDIDQLSVRWLVRYHIAH